MINKVNGNDYYDYTKLKMPDAADKTDNGEKFSLNYQRAQEEKDKKDKTKESEGAKREGRSTVMQGGVRLELSRSGQNASEEEHDGKDAVQASGQRLFDTVRSWLHVFVQSLKDIIYRIWNDPVPQEDVTETAISEAEEPERLTEEYLELNNLDDLRNPEETARQQLQREADRNKEIQKYLRSGNLEQVMSLVTDNGHKTMAKNSTLLTYYDRTGRIAPLSSSDQERILHGDKNVREL